MVPENSTQAPVTFTDVARAPGVLLGAPWRTALVMLSVTCAFMIWNLSGTPAYRTTVKLRVEDIAAKSPQIEHRNVPTGTITEGEALTTLRSRALAAEAVRELELTTWVTDENAPPLRRILRGAIAPVSSTFAIHASVRRRSDSAPRAVRVRFVAPDELSVSRINAKPGIEWEGDRAERVAYTAGETFEYAGLEVDLDVTGSPDGRVWRIEALSEDDAIDRVLARVRVDKQQHQPGTIGLTVTDEDPRRAAAIAASLAESFARGDLAQVAERAEAKVAYLEDQLAERQKALAELESAREAILLANPDVVAPEAARIELAQREGAWDDQYREARNDRIAAERVAERLSGGVDARTALAGLTADPPAEIAALTHALGLDEARLRAVARGSEDTGYRRTLLLKADDYTLEAQTFETVRDDLRAIVEQLERGDDSALGRLGGDLAREGSVAVNATVRLRLAEYEEAKQELNALRGVFKDSYEEVARTFERTARLRSAIENALATQLAGLERTLATKRENASFWRELFDSYPDAEAELIRASIAQLDEELRQAFASWVRGLELDEAAARRERSRLRARVRDLARAERELTALEPERAELETITRALLRDVENARIAAAGVEPSVRIVDPPTVPTRPFKPHMGFGLLAGMVLGLLCALLCAWRFGTAPPGGAIRAANVPEPELCGRVAVTGHGHGEPRTLRKVRAAGAQRSLWIPLMADPEGRASQMFRALRARLRHTAGRGGAPAKTIGLVSATRSSGSSTVALNLAMARAQIGERVLLVDANLAAPALERAIDAAGLESVDAFEDERYAVDGPRKGLAECLEGSVHWSDAARPSGFPSLDFLDAGHSSVVAADLFASRMFDLLCHETSEVYDCVVFDFAALETAPDAESAAGCLDGILLVEREKGEVDSARTHERLARSGGHVLGAVRTITIERRSKSGAEVSDLAA